MSFAATLSPQQLESAALLGVHVSSPSSTGATPEQEATASLFGGTLTAPGATSETPGQQADAAIVGLSKAAQAQTMTAELSDGEPPSEVDASQLVSQLAAEISSSSPNASSIYSVLSASAAYSLTKS